MTHWKAAWGIVLMLGVISIPMAAYAQMEGSMGGQASHEKQGGAGKKGMTKERETQEEAGKGRTADSETTATPHDEEKSGQRQMHEGSHESTQ